MSYATGESMPRNQGVIRENFLGKKSEPGTFGVDFRDLASRVQLTISGIWKERDKWDTLDLLVVKGRCPEEELLDGKDRLVSINSMLIGLIKANSDYRLHEGTFGQGD